MKQTTIRGPSIDRLVNELGITRESAREIKRSMREGKAKTALTLTDKAMGGYGIGDLWPEYPRLSFVNMGDTYDITLYYTGKSFQIGSWGDYVENHRGVPNDGMNPRDSKYWKKDRD